MFGSFLFDFHQFKVELCRGILDIAVAILQELLCYLIDFAYELRILVGKNQPYFDLWQHLAEFPSNV